MTNESKLADELEEVARKSSPGKWTACVRQYSVLIHRCETPKDLYMQRVADLPSWHDNAYGPTKDEATANATLIISLQNHLPEIIAALRRGS